MHPWNLADMKEKKFISSDIEEEGEKFENAHQAYENRVKRYQSLDLCLQESDIETSNETLVKQIIKAGFKKNI